MCWWDDMPMAVSFRTTGPNAAALANLDNSGIFVPYFTNGKEQFTRGQLRHSYQSGSPLYPHVHWLPATSETYTGTWTWEFKWCNPTQLTPISNKITVTGSISGAKTAWVPQVTHLDSEALTGDYKISALFIGRLALTLSAGTGIFLLDFDAHHENDSLGSAAEYVK